MNEGIDDIAGTKRPQIGFMFLKKICESAASHFAELTVSKKTFKIFSFICVTIDSV
jgi:hypothetical protein